MMKKRSRLQPAGTLWKAHGAGDDALVGAEPEGTAIEAMGLGWINTHGTGKGVDTITSGIEGPWTTNPIQWDMGYLDLLLKYEWECKKALQVLGNGIPLTVQKKTWCPK